MMKFSKLFAIPILLTSFLFITFYYYFDQAMMFSPWDFHDKKSENATNKGLKKILLWNSPHRIEVAAFGVGHQPFIDAGCPVTNCLIQANSSEFWIQATSNNSEIFKTFDAVLINIHELWLSFLPAYERPAGQRLVWLTQESPQSSGFHTDNSNKFGGLFNWTMSYKRDSDIQLLYGRVERIENQTRVSEGVRRKEKMAMLSKKSNTVAWMVSHCETNSRREDYVRQLQKHIQVDIFGECGNMSCPRNESHWISNPECYEMIGRKYKFYLSFENSFCYDYETVQHLWRLQYRYDCTLKCNAVKMTEKFFSILQLDVVPVVFGAADYRIIAPIHSYINALAFSSPAKLAEYLHLLDENDELYLDYFEWKSYYRVEAGVEQMARHAFCDLCAKLNREDEPNKIYDSMVSHWAASTQCKPGWTER